MPKPPTNLGRLSPTSGLSLSCSILTQHGSGRMNPTLSFFSRECLVDMVGLIALWQCWSNLLFRH